jgi:hypothetical protein
MHCRCTMSQGSCALQANNDDSEEEGPAAAPELFEDDGNTDLCVVCRQMMMTADLCVLCREMMMTAKKRHQLQPLKSLRMTATQTCECFAGKL